MIPSRLTKDAAALAEDLGVEHEVLLNGHQVYVVLKAVPMPAQYSSVSSDVLMITDINYPTSAMDMFWLEEAVVPNDGELPSYASSVEEYAGRRWRRWSWHRNGRWTAGVDDLRSHFAFIEECWRKEAA